MKKLTFVAATLLVLAGSAFQISSLYGAQFADRSSISAPSTASLRAAIPPPTCPPNDPEGCGIYDGL